MTLNSAENPFHAGERSAQLRAGAGDVAAWAGGFIRDHLPEQHRGFHSALPFLVLSGSDETDRTWVTLIDGPEGFIRSPDPQTLEIATQLDPQDPLFTTLDAGTDIGVLGIELASRRRNRLSGFFRKFDTGYKIDVRQTFGNCPQYIHERHWHRVEHIDHTPAQHAASLSPRQITLISRADTLFLGSGHMHGGDAPSRGYDASHRGGAPGYVKVESPNLLRIPDYAGNNFFNTIGNLISDPRIGVTFVDFDTGGLLQISGRASIDWEPQNTHDSDARRMINVTVEAVIERPGALHLRWRRKDNRAQLLSIVRRVEEAQDITSFYLQSPENADLPRFRAGQHLPIEVEIPGYTAPIQRSYTLSGDPQDTQQYRLTIKREPQGVVSQHFHQSLHVGARIRASEPSGTFLIPKGDTPLVLVSAGVGLTPMVSMLHSLAALQDPRPLWFVHGARDGSRHAMHDEVTRLVSRLPNARQLVFYSNPDERDKLGVNYHQTGRISSQHLLDLSAGAAAQYLLCGPVPFLSDIRQGLEAAGVPATNIQAEVFGA